MPKSEDFLKIGLQHTSDQCSSAGPRKKISSAKRFRKSTASYQRPSHRYSASQTTRCESSTPPYQQEQNRTASQAKVQVLSFRAARCSCQCRISNQLRTVITKSAIVALRLVSGESMRHTASKLCSIEDSCVGSTSSQRSGRKAWTSLPQMVSSLWITQALTPTTVCRGGRR
jgi:hypothetical protein